MYLLLVLVIISCGGTMEKEHQDENSTVEDQHHIEKLLSKYTEFELKTDLSLLTENERKMIPVIKKKKKIMD
ncbi:MAG: hypothetical protein KDC53_03435, partial [Saprospiraceae bacterium]|nr:hypothetical protein [Saprospiraceae bacterium]